MVEEYITPPSFCDVAFVAALPLATIVRIVGAVAGITIGCWLVFVQITRVTRSTTNADVFADQGKVSVYTVIKAHLRPSVWCMTRLALVTVTSLMRIIQTMAGDTGSIEIGLINVIVALVTSITTNLTMPAHEFKIGLTVVFETDLFPLAGLVTVAALSSVPTAVNIVEKMARSTVARRILVAGFTVTLVARYLRVGTSQSKLRGVVVELGLVPSVGSVTLCTLFTHLATVMVIAAVTVDTLRRSLAQMHVGEMAPLTREFAMQPDKREIGKAMV